MLVSATVKPMDHASDSAVSPGLVVSRSNCCPRRRAVVCFQRRNAKANAAPLVFLSTVERLLLFNFPVAAGKSCRSVGIKQVEEMKALHLSFNLHL